MEKTVREQAKELAKKMIHAYVLRGDSIESLAQGGLGVYGPGYGASIGGYLWQKKLASEPIKLQSRQVGVSKVNNVPCREVFSLQTLYDEIKNEEEHGQQLSLW